MKRNLKELASAQTALHMSTAMNLRFALNLQVKANALELKRDAFAHPARSNRLWVSGMATIAQGETKRPSLEKMGR